MVALVTALVMSSPATAQAWQVTVRVHGAGQVVETTQRALMHCSVPPDGRSTASMSTCRAGAPDGPYQHGDIVRLVASVPSTSEAAARGWRFMKWVDGTDAGQINCDPQNRTGDHFDAACQFQVFENLVVDVYFADVEGPGTSMSGGPPGVTNATTATFGFGSPESDARFECRLWRPLAQNAVWWPCGGGADRGESLSGLTENGAYAFEVRAKDPSGNVDPTPERRTWRVDTVAPEVQGLTGPPARTTSNDATFTWSLSEPVAIQRCRLDGAHQASCGSGLSLSGLAEGAHAFEVVAVDEAGNASRPATRTWEVDRTGPVTTVAEGGPSGATSATTAAFSFGSTAADVARFECRLERPGDPGGWAACTSPRSYSALGDGTYVFTARAVDDLDNVGAPSAPRRWTIDRTVPETTIDEGPAEDAAVEPAPLRMTFSSSEAGGSFTCAIDDAPAQPCTSPFTVPALAPGRHVVAVTARDAVGNADPSPAVRRFTVLHRDGDGDGVRADADCRDDDAAVRPGVTDVPEDGVDQDCSGADAATPAPGGGGGTAAPPAPVGAVAGTVAARPAVVAGVLTSRWRSGPRDARPERLQLVGLAPGTEVRVRCRGRGCSSARRATAPRSGVVDVRRLLRGGRLRVGAVLTIELRAAGRTTKVLTLTGRARRTPVLRTRCLRPGSTAPGVC